MDKQLLRAPRANSSSSVLEDKLARRYSVPVEAINRFVDDIRQERRDDSVPYVDPDTGGTQARVLTLFQDPGPKTRSSDGSGMLSWCNDDPSAETFCVLLRKVGIDWDLLIPWNAVPWYTGGHNTSRDLAQGRRALVRLMNLLPNLTAVLTAGGTARRQWTSLLAENPIAGQLRLFPTLHPAGRGLTLGGQQKKIDGLAAMESHLHLLRDYLSREPSRA